MKIFGRLSAAFAAILALATCQTGEPQPNLGLYKQRLVRWHDSGEYEKYFAREAARAVPILRRAGALARQSGQRPAIVLDIDETSLSNWGYLRETGFALDEETFSQWSRLHDDPALSPVKALFDEARKRGVAVFFITGRKESLRTATIRQLQAAGYSGWTGLFMRPESYDEASVIPYKSGMRKMLEERQGYRLILNVGDQWSDLQGGYSENAVKLPNPFYYIP